MKKAVVFLMSGDAHAPYLVVSLATLQEHWQGDVRIYAWPESIDTVRKIAADGRWKFNDVLVQEEEPVYRARRDERRQGKNDQFLAKLRLFPTLDLDLSLYLDADTSVHGDLSPLFRVAEEYGFCATRFSSWTTSNGIPRTRIERLREFGEIDAKMIDETLATPWPSVNGGVWCARPNSPVLKLWEEWTWAARSVFIADEAVLHVLQPVFVPKRQMAVWPDGRFNCSCNPKWLPEKMGEHEVVVFHYHGDSAVRPDKFGGAGYRRWWPMFQTCLKNNVGNMQGWIDGVENRWMRVLQFEESK